MRKTVLSLLIMAGVSVQAYAQSAVAIKYGDLITPQSAKAHLSILASDEFEGRETGKAGAEKAAQYIAAEFKKIGLRGPVNQTYFQRVALIEDKTIVPSFQVNNTSFKFGQSFFFSGNPAAKIVNTKEIVFVGYGISSQVFDELAGVDLKDKVVLVINYGEPTKNGVSAITKTSEASEWANNPAKRVQNLLAKQPALILAVHPETEMVLKEHSKHFTSGKVSTKNPNIATERMSVPVVNITPAMATEFLKSTGKSIQDLKEEIDHTGKPISRAVPVNFMTTIEVKRTDLNAANVLGYLEGSDLKNELLVISAHYDHVGINEEGTDRVYNGADDDGSGTTAVLEIAKAFAQAKKDGKGPRRSILFLGNVGEEKGLLGSQWYSDNPVFPLAQTVTNLNIDMIGRVDPEHKADTNYCYLVGSDKLSADLHQISEKTNATYTKFKIDYKYNNPNDPERIYYRSDHYNFAKHNIPVIFYFNGIHEDYHKPSDEIDKIDFNLLTRRAKLVYFTAWEIANRDKRPALNSTVSK